MEVRLSFENPSIKPRRCVDLKCSRCATMSAGKLRLFSRFDLFKIDFRVAWVDLLVGCIRIEKGANVENVADCILLLYWIEQSLQMHALCSNKFAFKMTSD